VLEVSSGKERWSIASAVRQLALVAFSADGRALFAAGQDAAIHCFSMETGKELTQLSGHERPVMSLAVSGDGKTLVSGSQDTTVLAWSLAGINGAPKAPLVELDAARAEALWNDLGSDDARKAYAALRILSQAPKQAVPLLKERVKVVTAADPERIKQLVAALGDQRFAVRQKATAELEKLGAGAVGALQKILADKPPLDVQKSIEGVLERLAKSVTSPTTSLRDLRALEVLEQTGTAEARQVVEALAKGAAGTPLTRSGQQTLSRMARR
jgi:hypothetical protein